MHQQLSHILIALLILCIYSSSISAGNHKFHTALSCVPAWANYEYSKDRTGTYNHSNSTTQRWFCPMIQDDNNHTITATFHVHNYNPYKKIKCTMKTRSSGGSAYQYSIRSSGYDDGYSQLSHATLNIVKEAYTTGYCDIPNKHNISYSRIVGYTTDEK